jgi:class 3 adenylate cyclase
MGILIKRNKGEITSFDGDRIMGVFIDRRAFSLDRNSRALVCSLQMNYSMTNIIKPKVEKYISSIRQSGFDISHTVGIDTSEVLVTKAGPYGVNDRVWIGRAPNFAAKLSDIREPLYSTWITHDVFSSVLPSLKEPFLMWNQYTHPFAGSNHYIYGSNYYYPI